MVEISLSGSGRGPGRAIAPGYQTPRNIGTAPAGSGTSHKRALFLGFAEGLGSGAAVRKEVVGAGERWGNATFGQDRPGHGE